MIFFLVLSLVTSHGSITINLNQNNHLNNGNKLTLHHQRSLSKRSQNAKFCILFFWDYNGVILKEPVPAGTTITKIYYANLLINKLHPEIKKRRRGLISTGVILHHDNASAHTSYHALSTIHNLDTNCFVIHLTLQIWLPVIITCFHF